MKKDKPKTLDERNGYALQQIVERDDTGRIVATYFEIVAPNGEVVAGPIAADDAPYALFEQIVAERTQPARKGPGPRM